MTSSSQIMQIKRKFTFRYWGLLIKLTNLQLLLGEFRINKLQFSIFLTLSLISCIQNSTSFCLRALNRAPSWSSITRVNVKINSCKVLGFFSNHPLNWKCWWKHDAECSWNALFFINHSPRCGAIRHF